MNVASRVYFAHPICIYGSLEEDVQLQRIHGRFPKAEVVNPAENPGGLQDPEATMNHYYRLLESCNLVVFTRLYGKITSGVGKEVNRALGRGMSVYELRGRRFIRRQRRVKFVSRDATVRLYERWLRSRGRAYQEFF